MQHKIDKFISKMQAQVVIEESSKSWCSPVLLRWKKYGSIRFCVDFRKINAVTIKDSLLLPRTDDTLDRLIRNSWISTLDSKSGYWQIKIKPEDKMKRAFSTGKGLWQFKVMTFGLYNSLAIFERLMEDVLHGLLYFMLHFINFLGIKTS